MKDTTPLLHAVPRACALLGGIGRTKFYDLANKGEIELVKIGSRTFATDESIRRVAAEGSRREEPCSAEAGR